MADVLGPQPVTVSLANRCMDRPALTRDSVTGTWFLASAIFLIRFAGCSLGERVRPQGSMNLRSGGSRRG